MAVHAFLKCERLLEISVGVALGTIHAGMPTFKREPGFGVIEPLVDRFERDLLPPVRVVARLATLGKAAVVRVFVAVGALIKGDAHVLRLAIGPVGVALGALHLRVQARQRITRLRVIELAGADRLPVFEIVALLTRCPETTFVLILVTRDTASREAEVRSVQIFYLDARAFLRADVRRIMTFVTRQSRVLAFEDVSRFLVIEGRHIPLDQWKIFSVVLGMAPRTLPARSSRNVVGGVQAFVG